MWTVQSALKTGPPEDYVTSCTALYLEQDLYCLATTHGSVYVLLLGYLTLCRYDPWPRTVDVNKVPAGISRKQQIKSQQLLASKKNGVLDVLNNLGKDDENSCISPAKAGQRRSVSECCIFSKLEVEGP